MDQYYEDLFSFGECIKKYCDVECKNSKIIVNNRPEILRFLGKYRHIWCPYIAIPHSLLSEESQKILQKSYDVIFALFPDGNEVDIGKKLDDAKIRTPGGIFDMMMAISNKIDEIKIAKISKNI